MLLSKETFVKIIIILREVKKLNVETIELFKYVDD